MSRAIAFLALAAFLTPSPLLLAAEGDTNVSFKRTELDRKFRSEGVCAGDFNNDGKLDIAAGSVYYAAPDWKMVSVMDKPAEYDPNGYSNSFCNFADDLNGDGRTDLIVVDFPGQQTWWLEQPEKAGEPFKRHVITPVTNNESPALIDVDGDNKRDLLFSWDPGKYVGYAKRGSEPTSNWELVRVSSTNAPGSDKYSHGIGTGDVNKDGRNDVLVKEGWWECPADRKGEWKFHPTNFGSECAQMHVYDYDGDGDNDVLTSSAHGVGIWWHEQGADGWKSHEISKLFSQTHSLCLADINGDKLPDFISGKRWWAHGPNGDVDPAADPVVYWFELQQKDGKPVWTPHKIDDQSGVGTQFEVVDVNQDGLLDVITANKRGAFYFEQVRK